MRSTIYHLELKMKHNMNKEDYKEFLDRQRIKPKSMAESINNTQTSKIEKIKQKKFESLKINYNEDWFINKTNIEFPEECKWMLTLGEKFALPISNKTFSPIHIIADIEESIRTLGEDREKEIARAKIANRISTFKRTIKQTSTEKFILSIYQQTHRFIRKHKDNIIITSADKGNKTVVMYRNE